MRRPDRRAVPALVALALVAGACSNKPLEPKDYVARLAAARASKDADFAKGSDSPIPEARRSALLPLAYFPIEPDYDVPAVLKPTSDRTVFQMPTSTGTPRDMRRVGSLEFTLKGQPLKMTVFMEVADSHLFVAFSDLTSGAETYPAGRYIDIEPNSTGIYEIDFNKAYNPYCYYNQSYECPYPPAENRLKIPVRAGERMKSTPAVAK